MEDAWRDQYPSLMCLVHHRHDTDVIVDCAKRLLDEGKDPSWFEGMWDNMGGGIPADTSVSYTHLTLPTILLV